MNSKMIIVNNACPVMLEFAQIWRFYLDGRPECKDTIDRTLALLAESSSTPDIESVRSWMGVEWMAKELAPIFLDLTPSLKKHASILRALPPIVEEDSANNAKESLEAARKSSWKEVQFLEKAKRLIAECSAKKVSGWTEAGASGFFGAQHASAEAGRPAAWEASTSKAWEGIRSMAIDAAKTATGPALAGAVETGQASAFALLVRMSALGEKDPCDLSLFLDCSRDESDGISEEEQDAFLEAAELRKLIPLKPAPRKKTRRI